MEILLPGGLLGSGPGEACDKDSGRHRNDLVEEQTWKKTKKIKLKRTYNYTRAMLCFTMFQQEK